MTMNTATNIEDAVRYIMTYLTAKRTEAFTIKTKENVYMSAINFGED